MFVQLNKSSIGCLEVDEMGAILLTFDGQGREVNAREISSEEALRLASRALINGFDFELVTNSENERGEALMDLVVPGFDNDEGFAAGC